MKFKKSVSLLTLSFLLGCSSTGKRSIAEIDATKEELSQTSIKQTLKGILHSYLLGQVLLIDFDAYLDKNPSTAMESDSYSELLAIRTMVDELEENIDQFYLELVMISALPKYTTAQKEEAQKSLAIIGQFMSGISEKRELPENLRPLVLGNLLEKQTRLYDELLAAQQDPAITNNDEKVIAVIDENMVNLRGTRPKYFKEIKSYKVDEKALAASMTELKKDSDFKAFRSNVKKMSKEIKKITKEVMGGRSTSSDTIFPSAGAAGNITGRSFPAKTWSLTFDDGPSSKMTPLVVKNLLERDLKATFFMQANQVQAHPSTAQSVVDAGMEIANHSFDHPQLTKVGPSALEKQIGGSKKIIEEKLGKKVKLFRLPYGAGVSVDAIRAKIAEHGMIHVFWNVDTLDWQDKDPASIVRRAKKQMAGSPKNSGIILFHDVHTQSVTASRMLMDELKKAKLTVCTVQGVVDQMNEGRGKCL